MALWLRDMMYLTAKFVIAEKRLRLDMSCWICSPTQMIHAGKPLRRGRPLIWAIADARPIVAIVPLSRYLKGLGSGLPQATSEGCSMPL